MPAQFVNDTTALYVERWGGFQPCVSINDCLFLNEEPYEKVTDCKTIASGPIHGQKYCQCDFGLAGAECTEMTEAAVIRAIVFGISAALALSILPLVVREIIARFRVLRWNAMVISLSVAFAGCVMNILWGAFGLYFIIADGRTHKFAKQRRIYMHVIIPATLTSSFAASMIISLAWRKVVNDLSVVKFTVNVQAVEKRERVVARAVVAMCAFLFLAVGLALVFVSVQAASMVLFVCNLVGFVFFYRSGKSFQSSMFSTFNRGQNGNNGGEPKAKAKKKVGPSPEQQCLLAARHANGTIAKGMTLVAVCSILLVFTQPYILAQTFCVAGASAGVVICHFAIVSYSKKVRMIRVNLRKTRNEPTYSETGVSCSASPDTETKSAHADSLTSVGTGCHGNKVSPARMPSVVRS
jgi:hypothetical protein